MAEGANFNAETNNLLTSIRTGQEAARRQQETINEERRAEQAKVDEQLALDNRIEDLLKLGSDRAKQKSQDDKVAQAEQLERLNEFNITNSDVADAVLADLKNGIVWKEEELKAMQVNAEALARQEAAAAKTKREAEVREEERQATNLKTEENLSNMLGIMGLSQETADRVAKRAMQMKESVHKWWEDKKEGMAKGAKSILEWLMKAAGLAMIWLIFKALAKVDWVKLYDNMKLWIDIIWTALTRFFAMKGIIQFSKWLKGTKIVKGIIAIFKSVIALIKLVLGGGLKGLLKIFNFMTKGVFTKTGAIGKRVAEVIKWFKGGKGGLPAKIAEMWKKATSGLKAGLTIAKGWATSIKSFFSSAKGSLVEKIKNIWKAVTGPVMKALDPVIKTIKGALKPLMDFFKTGKSATGAGGLFSKISAIMTKVMPGVKSAMGFLKTVGKIFGKLFAPITVFMAAWAAISGGMDEAEKESGGFPQKILSFISGALKGLIDFFVFDLANLIQDGIKWAIGWFMGLFGFSEEEIEKATDFDFVKPIRDAVMDAIDWIRDLFRFDGKGVDFSKLAKFIDILLWPLNQAIKWIRKLFGFEEKEGEEFSLGKLITDALNNIFAWFKKLLDFDFGAMAENLMPDFMKGWFTDSKEDVQEDIDALQKQMKIDKSVGSKKRNEDRLKKVEELQARLAKMGTGGMILPGGAAIVGEGSMAGEMVVNAASAAKVIPAKQTAAMMSGMGGGQNFAPTTIVNSAPTSTSTIMASSSLNPISQKYFRSD